MPTPFDIEKQDTEELPRKRLIEDFLSADQKEEERVETRHQETVDLLKAILLRTGGTTHAGGGGGC